jgi:predicted enzyme related to lactoylglutathione lyase
MTEATTTTVNRPAWVDLATSDADAARAFYQKVFGWRVEVNPDPQYGGYGIAKLDGRDAAGIGPVQSPQQPTTWSFYIGTDDVDRLSESVQAAGGTVIAPPFDVGDQGRMATFQDPTGAAFSAWQGTRMGGFQTTAINGFGWAELTSTDIDAALAFYREVLGWESRRSPMPGGPDYIEFQVEGESVAGAWAMDPAQMGGAQSQWMVYFSVDDIDATFRTAIEAGGREVSAPQAYPGGKYAILTDPQGAAFGLLTVEPGQR